jgi:hypothetical protein
MKKKTLWITRTAVMIALLVALQAVTKSLGQFVTGSCVNLILAVSTLVGGLWCGLTVAILSPFFAFLLAIGTPIIQIVPAIALGNAAFVAVLGLLFDRAEKLGGVKGRIAAYGSVALAAAVKLAVLFLVVVQLMLPLLGLPEKQTAALSASFSWPQLVTALIGGAIAATVVPLIRRATRKT